MKSRPGSKVALALGALRREGRLTPQEMGAVLGLDTRQIHGHLKHAISRGEIGLVETGRNASNGKPERDFVRVGDAESVSVRRPKVARDVWQFAQGAPL